MKSKRVGILMGGSSAEREISLRSGRAVALALEEAGHDVVRLELGHHDPAELLRRSGIDVAFLALHGRFGEDGCIQGLLELLGIPYTGSGVLESALAMDKLKSKELFRLHNVPTPSYYVFSSQVTEQSVLETHGSFGFPAVVKPRREGSSVGLRLVENEQELVEAFVAASEHDRDILVERFVRGQEITVGILNGRVLGAIEVAPKSGIGIYDFAAKYTPGMTDYHVPARLNGALYKNVLFLAERAAQALGVSGAVRIDLIVTEQHNEYVLEVNTLPGMTPTSLMPKIAEAAGYGFIELCETILSAARLHVQGTRPNRVAPVVPLTQVEERSLRVVAS